MAINSMWQGSPLHGIATMPDGGVYRIIPRDAVQALMMGGADFTPSHWRLGLWAWLSGQMGALEISRCLASGRVPNAVANEWEVCKLLQSPSFAAGKPEAERRRIAERWITGLITGGYTEAAAVALIVERDIPGWCVAPAIVHQDELPPGRYRQAWRRSHNGGPVWVDDAAAVKLEERQLWEAYTHDTRAA